MQYYPIYLNLKGRRAVVVGGGTIAGGKVRALLEAGATVTLIAPRLTRALQGLASEGLIEHVARAYRPGDLAGAFLVISATDDHAVNEEVWHETSQNDTLVNVVDDIPHCTFIAPSIVRQGDLTIAISTGGKAPVLAVRLRERLERELGDEYARFLELAGELRAPLAARHPDFERRKALWYELVDSDILDLLRRGDEAAARQRIAEITGIDTLQAVETEPSPNVQQGESAWHAPALSI